MNKTTFNATDFAHEVGCSRRFARYWLRKYTRNYPDAHVRLDGMQFTQAVADYKEQRYKRAAARTRARTIAPINRVRRRIASERLRLKALVLAAFAECGNASEAARRAGCPTRTARRWVENVTPPEVRRCQND